MSIPSARSVLIKTMHMDAEGLLPESIRDQMLATPCRRMLREIHGGVWRAIFAWAWRDIKGRISMRWYLIRSKFYITKEEREWDIYE